VVISGKEALGVGTLRFYGPTKFRDGIWAGVEYATAIGKNDGAVEGTRYFSCPQDHGVFVPAKSIVVQVCRLVRCGVSGGVGCGHT
jgi:dynactin complex subunit